MSSQIKLIAAVFILICTASNSPVYALETGGSSRDSSGFIGETQQRRAAERFNILDWVRSQQAAVNAQNARYGKGGGSSGPYPDFVLLYEQDAGTVTRDGVTLGKDTRGYGRLQFLLDDLFTRGSRTKSLNIDLGLEGFYGQTTLFAVDATSSQLSHSYTESGGGLLIRPFGRSSQDTGLLLKGGYTSISETGLWANNQTQVSLYAPYLGAEVKLYLLNFLGIYGDYQNDLETPVDALASKWKGQKFTYGAFLEIYLLRLSAYLQSAELILSPNVGSAPIKENYTGLGFAASLYF